MSAPGHPADLSHIDTWLFDLDNTLYPAESGFMDGIEHRMTDYVARATGLPGDEAFRLQKQYLSEHGLTLRGMMLNHGVDPLDFNAMFHDLALDALAHDPELVEAIAGLPGRRVIFTNADDIHAQRVLDHLGLAPLFDEVFHIGSFGYVPKPDPIVFHRICAEHGVAATTTAFFEDSEKNLAPAAALGMTTVLVGAHAQASTAPFVHHRTDKLTPFLKGARLRDA